MVELHHEGVGEAVCFSGVSGHQNGLREVTSIEVAFPRAPVVRTL